MNFRKKNLIFFLALLATAGWMVGCGDDEINCGAEGETVYRITGVVFNVDNFEAAEGVEVSLIDRPDCRSKKTNAEGEFSIIVPKGSPFVLITDDKGEFGKTTGDWYPVINTDEYSIPTVEKDYTAWPIHACPTFAAYDYTQAQIDLGIFGDPQPEIGSLATYQNYFKNATEVKDAFDPVKSVTQDNAGIVFVWTLWMDSNEDSGLATDTPGSTILIDAPEFPEAYINNANMFGDGITPNPRLGPNMFQDTGKTDFSGNMMSFGNPTFTGKTVKVTVTPETHVAPQVTRDPFSYDLPVRPNHFTLWFPAQLDGEPATMQDAFVFFELITL